MTRWAIVGCGQIARDKTIPALLACTRASLVAVCDTRADVAGQLAKKLKTPVFSSTEDLLREAAFDCAYVATPTAAHVAPVRALLNAGRQCCAKSPSP